MNRLQTVLTGCALVVGLATSVAVIVLARCDNGAQNGSPSLAVTKAGPGWGGALEGAGSTFIYPLMSRWSSEYPRLAPGIAVNYRSTGSADGIQQLTAHSVQFGATDAPMTDQQLDKTDWAVLHIPLALGAVVPTYNLPALKHPIRFTPEVLAGIFLGDIKTWNDARIGAVNSDLQLPAIPVMIVHRSDGSGTTYVWTDYLSKVSPDWRTKVGAAMSVNWPVGVASRGNEGVASTIRQASGAIGYAELTYVLQNKMQSGQIRNQSGNFVDPTLESVTTAAAAALSSIPEDMRYSMTDSPGEAAWPVSGTTWALIYREMAPGPDRKALIAFLRWAVHAGQKYCAPLDFAPLPPLLVEAVDAKLNQIESVTE